MILRVLIAVASRHGSTQEIARRIQAGLERAGFDVELEEMNTFPDPAVFDAVILGSAIYMGNWMGEAREYVQRYQEVLNDGTVWMFSSGPLGDPDLTPQDDPKRLPAQLGIVDLKDHRIFAGALDPATLGIGERIVTRMVKAPSGDFRDWDAIDSWANDIAQELNAPSNGSALTDHQSP
jgi:menaquinone-dependent protoporphyrinogen oxidase